MIELQINAIFNLFSSYSFADEMNAQSFHDIQSSIAVCCLDETETFSDEETKNQYDSRWGLCGGGSKLNSGNRWFDKGFLVGYSILSLRVILFKAAVCIINCDKQGGYSHQSHPIEDRTGTWEHTL